MRSERVAIYPGSFDPITNGHIDIILRGKKLFDRIIVAVLRNSAKQTLFTMEERMEMIGEAFQGDGHIEVDSFSGLLVDYAHAKKVKVIVRGLRAISDFDIELQMALLNRKISSDVETIFFMPSIQYSYLSSRLVKEVYSLGGELSGMLPAHVHRLLREKYRA